MWRMKVVKINTQVDITLDMVLEFIDEQLNTIPLSMIKIATDNKMKQLKSEEQQKEEWDKFWFNS